MIICSVSACSQPVRTKGLCNRHYLRAQRHGAPTMGGRSRVTHDGLGKAYPVEYGIWDAMIYRCHVESAAEYADYGGRGVTVCERWREGFSAFLADMGVRPSEQLSIDRIDNDGNYEPGNVRWATPRQQSNNRRVTKMLTVGGELRPLADVARDHGIRPNTLFMRVFRYGYSVEQALNAPIKDVGQRRSI